MELGVFVVAFVLIAGIGLIAFGRMPFRTRRSEETRLAVAPAPADGAAPAATRTAELPGRVDDSG